MTDFKKYLDQLYNQKFKDSVINYIHLMCIQYNIKNYTINDDLSLDVDGDVSISANSLAFIPLFFNVVNGGFWCECNKLISLYGSPNIVNGDFNCSYNELESLEHFPEYVGGDIYCTDNKLVTMKHIPPNFKNDLNCGENHLISTMCIPFGLADLRIKNNNFPRCYNILSAYDKQLILKYQEEYGIWYGDGELNVKRFEYLVNDIKVEKLE